MHQIKCVVRRVAGHAYMYQISSFENGQRVLFSHWLLAISCLYYKLFL